MIKNLHLTRTMVSAINHTSIDEKLAAFMEATALIPSVYSYQGLKEEVYMPLGSLKFTLFETYENLGQHISSHNNIEAKKALAIFDKICNCMEVTGDFTSLESDVQKFKAHIEAAIAQ